MFCAIHSHAKPDRNDSRSLFRLLQSLRFKMFDESIGLQEGPLSVGSLDGDPRYCRYRIGTGAGGK